MGPGQVPRARRDHPQHRRGAGRSARRRVRRRHGARGGADLRAWSRCSRRRLDRQSRRLARPRDGRRRTGSGRPAPARGGGLRRGRRDGRLPGQPGCSGGRVPRGGPGRRAAHRRDLMDGPVDVRRRGGAPGPARAGQLRSPAGAGACRGARALAGEVPRGRGPLQGRARQGRARAGRGGSRGQAAGRRLPRSRRGTRRSCWARSAVASCTGRTSPSPSCTSTEPRRSGS